MNIHGRPEQERMKGDKADLIAVFKQLRGCPEEEGLDLFGLVPEVDYGPLFQMTVMGDRFW